MEGICNTCMASKGFVMDVDEVSNFVMKQGHGVKGLADLNIPSLPTQYIQPLAERSGSFTRTHISIPIIDLSAPLVELERSICSAAERFGFFQVINHGVPLEVLESVKEATFRFFEFPAEKKKKYLKENSKSNHVRYVSSFNPEKEKALEWKDFLTLYFVSHDEALALWPPTCRDQLLDYMKRCEVLVDTLISLFVKGLGMDMGAGIESMIKGSKRINLNYYPKCPDPNFTVGVGRHSDVSSFTILLQDDIGGLYVRSPEEVDDCKIGGSWIHVPPAQGSLVINIGDALQIMSNGRYKSAEHRVVANASRNRISIPYFVNPRPSDMIGPLDQVLERSGEKPKYKKVLYSDYVLNFYRNAHHGKDTLNHATI